MDTLHESSTINPSSNDEISNKRWYKKVYEEQHVAIEMFAVHDVEPTSAPSTSKEPKDKQTMK